MLALELAEMLLPLPLLRLGLYLLRLDLRFDEPSFFLDPALIIYVI